MRASLLVFAVFALFAVGCSASAPGNDSCPLAGAWQAANTTSQYKLNVFILILDATKTFVETITVSSGCECVLELKGQFAANATTIVGSDIQCHPAGTCPSSECKCPDFPAGKTSSSYAFGSNCASMTVVTDQGALVFHRV